MFERIETVEDPFLQYWFKGFSKALNDISEEDKKIIFSQCGKACSDSYTKQIYVDEYKNSKTMEDFLSRLKVKFPEMDYLYNKTVGTITLTYHYCACDLVRKGYIKTPSLCECSRQSLLYNWGTVLDGQAFYIRLLKSILGGGDCCQFEIRLLAP